MERLKFDRPKSAEQDSLERAARVLAEIISARLKLYPHHVILRDSDPVADPAWAKLLCRTMASLDPQKMGPKGLHAISTTRVRVDDASTGTKDGVTRYSRTNRPMAPHTDSSYLADPHELIAFQMIEADREGGDSVVIAVEDLLPRLAPATAARLREEIFPFGRGNRRILFGKAEAPKIRYYRAQIELAVAGGADLTDEARQAMDELDAVLAEPEIAKTMTLREGEILFLDNTRALHGRGGFDQRSRRELLRLRAHVGRLV